jgi:hypothetical protein
MKALVRVAYVDLSKDVQEAAEWLLASEEVRLRLSIPSKFVPDFDGNIDIVKSRLGKEPVESSANAILGRKYFVSTNNYIGFIPEAAQEGALICIFMSGRISFFTRPAGENYQLLEGCYVHDIMYGEAMKEFEKQGGEMQDFILV